MSCKVIPSLPRLTPACRRSKHCVCRGWGETSRRQERESERLVHWLIRGAAQRSFWENSGSHKHPSAWAPTADCSMTRGLFKEPAAATVAKGFWDMSAQNLATFWEQSPGGLSWAVGSSGGAGLAAGMKRERSRDSCLPGTPQDKGWGQDCLGGVARVCFSAVVGLGQGTGLWLPRFPAFLCHWLPPHCPFRPQSQQAPHFAVQTNCQWLALPKPPIWVFGEHAVILLCFLQNPYSFLPVFPAAFHPPTLGQTQPDQTFILS